MFRWKFFFFACIFSLGLCLTGCTSKNQMTTWMQENGKLKVLCTISQIGNVVEEIGGERIDPWTLIQGNLDPHSYELVKGDVEKFDRAQLIFYNGLGLEHGASLSAKLRASKQAISLGDWLHAQDRSLILYKGDAVDPHIWMDISLWERIVQPIVDRLSELDPEGKEYYQARAKALLSRMQALDQALRDQMQAIAPEKRYLVTSHDAFHYFTRRYLAEPGEKDWSKRFAAPEGLAPDGQLSPVDIQQIIDFLKEKHICVIFPESNVSRDSLQKIASASRQLGFVIQICQDPLYGDAMGELTYLGMMQHNGEVIARGLHGKCD